MGSKHNAVILIFRRIFSLHKIFYYFLKNRFRHFFCKHIILTLLTKKMPKNAEKFHCEKCNFTCSKKSNYKQHLTTAKHKKLTMLTDKMPNLSEDFECTICNKQYKSRMGLWQHQQKCTPKQDHQEEPIQETSETLPEVPTMSMFVDLLKQNQELQKQLIEAVKTSGQHIENQTNINNNHQRFNLNFFLNEQCKDAINMSDFLENMELNLEDLTETGRLGYVGGISRILVNKLQELDVYKRPMHCTDMKRETLYIKDNDEWEKQVNSKEKIQTIINKVANKNCQNLPQWRDEHPESQVFDTPENIEYMNLCNVSLGGFGEEENRQYRDKILRSVVKEIVVGK